MYRMCRISRCYQNFISAQSLKPHHSVTVVVQQLHMAQRAQKTRAVGSRRVFIYKATRQ